MNPKFSILVGLFLAAVTPTGATTRYVDVNSGAPTPPFTNWAAAAVTIQDAVDAAAAGDEVVVTNGVYAAGGRAYTGTMTNRVLITKRLTIRSVNGPEVTVIQGYQLPGVTNGDGAVRCVYLGADAVLSGFTLTGGATRADVLDAQGSGGGIYGVGLVTNCVVSGNSAYYHGGGAYNSRLDSCLIASNQASVGGGGGAYMGYLDNCIVTTNWGGVGGGAFSATLHNCLVTGNYGKSGGGVYEGWLFNCTVVGNSAKNGGGTSASTLYNCIVHFNRADRFGANYDSGTFNYCCTAPLPTNGVANISLDPQLASASHLSSKSPCRAAGNAIYAWRGDIDGEPWCSTPSIGCDEYREGAVTGSLTVQIGGGFTNVALGYEAALSAIIEGRTSGSVWDFGDGTVVSNRPFASHQWSATGEYLVKLTAYNESNPEGVSASLRVDVQNVPFYYVAIDSANPIPPYDSWTNAASDIQSAIDAATVPGAVVLVSNGVYNVGGRSVYGSMTNRVVINKPVAVQSVNGPSATIIEGYQLAGTTNGNGAIRCVYIGGGGLLSGFTLRNGATRALGGDMDREQSGGGVWYGSSGGMVTNCIITGNCAYQNGGGAYAATMRNCFVGGNVALQGGGIYYGDLANCMLATNLASTGGGAHYGSLNNCIVAGNKAQYGGGSAYTTAFDCAITNNSASGSGGGAYWGILNNCALLHNWAGQYGGGAAFGTFYNCIIYFNDAVQSGGNYSSSALNFCCSVPLPASGTDNFTNDPLFVDVSAGDFHLQSGSPCINSGNNSCVSSAIDLDGNARIAGGTVDVGAYEFQNPLSLLSYAWLQSYGLPTDGSADLIDSDADGMINWQEWIAGTDPTNPLSVLKIVGLSNATSGIQVSWQSVGNRKYSLQRAAAFSDIDPFSTVQTNIIGQVSATSFLDTNATGPGPWFYRVGVQR